MALKLTYWLIALIASLVAACAEQDAWFITVITYRPVSAFSSSPPETPAHFSVDKYDSGGDRISNIWECQTTLGRANWLSDVIVYGTIAVLSVIHLLFFYLIWRAFLAPKPKRRDVE